MLPKPLDVLIAFKIIGLETELSNSHKRIAIAIIDSFNKKTGQCDPSLERIAHLVGSDRRTVIRGIAKLEKLDLIHKDRHGGKYHRNSYVPNWPQFRQAEEQWSARKKTRHWGVLSSEPSPSTWQNSLGADGKPVTQTYNFNTIPETNKVNLTENRERGNTSIESSSEKLARKDLAFRLGSLRSKSFKEIAYDVAEKRVAVDLNCKFRTAPKLYGDILHAIDEELFKAAIAVEMKKKGAGLRLILEKLGRQPLEPES